MHIYIQNKQQQQQTPTIIATTINTQQQEQLHNQKTIKQQQGLPNFCQEVVNGLKLHLLHNFEPIPNTIPIPIPEGPKSDCITKEVQDLLLDDVIEQVLPNRYSKSFFTLTPKSFNGLIITPDSVKGPVINAKEQRKVICQS
ncbi:hypothetical protein ACTFIR_011934 [Dictyostelium discoideum]